MDVDAGRSVGNSVAHVDVIVAIEVRMDTALQGDLGGVELLCFAGARGDVVEGE